MGTERVHIMDQIQVYFQVYGLLGLAIKSVLYI